MKLFSLALTAPLAFAQDEHDHEHLCEPVDSLTDLADISCQTTEAACNYEVSIDRTTADVSTTDLCSELNEVCGYHIHDGEYEGRCLVSALFLDNNCPVTMSDTDRELCIDQAAENCDVEGIDQCNDSCLWLQECAAIETFCSTLCSEDHADLSHCGAKSFTCGDLSNLSLTCANLIYAQELDDYCIDKRMAKFNMFGAAAFMFFTLGTSKFVPRLMIDRFVFSNEKQKKSTIAKLIESLAAGCLISGAIYSSLRLSCDYARLVDWETAGKDFYPTWLIFSMLFCAFAMIYQLFDLRNVTILGPLILNAFAWGSMIGSQTVTSGVWLWTIIAFCSLSIDLWTSKTNIMTASAVMVVVCCASIILFNLVIRSATSIEGSSGTLAMAGCLQLFLGLRIWMRYTIVSRENKKKQAYNGAAMILAAVLSTVVYIFTKNANEAYYDVYITNY